MNCVGVDVSKGKSMVAVMRPFGEVVIEPFEVRHSRQELGELARRLSALEGETRVVMESTGRYHTPVAVTLAGAGFYVSVVNAVLVHGYGNTLRRAKTDRKDALKLASYGLDNWHRLPRFAGETDRRALLKNCYRQYQLYAKLRNMLKNNLISLLDSTFPDVNRLFSGGQRSDGREKWVDFAAQFWHCRCVSDLTPSRFRDQYQRWCRRLGYVYRPEKAQQLHQLSRSAVAVLPKDATTRLLVMEAISQLRAASQAAAALRYEMQALARLLPEYPVVMGMFGVGPALGPQLMAEIGDVRRFRSKKALVAFAGIDAPPYQSGQMDVRSRSISKRGSASLRRTLFLVMSVHLQTAPPDEPIYRFLDKKRAEGKPYKVYMMAAANKFLRGYYAAVKRYLDQAEAAQAPPDGPKYPQFPAQPLGKGDFLLYDTN